MWFKLCHRSCRSCRSTKFGRGSKKMTEVDILVCVKHMILWTLVMILWSLLNSVGCMGLWVAWVPSVRRCMGGEGQNLRGSRGLQESINFWRGSISFLLGSNFCVGLNFYVGLKFLCVSKNFAWVWNFTCVRTHMHKLEFFYFIFYRLERKLRMLRKVILNFWLATSVSLLYVWMFFSPLSKT